MYLEKVYFVVISSASSCGEKKKTMFDNKLMNDLILVTI